MQPEPYAPYPLSLLRDWLHRRRNWVRLGVALVLGVWLGPGAYRLWVARPVSGSPLAPFWQTDAGLNFPPPELDRTKELLAALASLPTRSSVGPTTAPAGQQWVRLDQYKQIRSGAGLAKGEKPLTPPATFYPEPNVLLTDPWTPARFTLRETINYLELPQTQAALQKISELSGQPCCARNGGSGAGLYELRQALNFLVGRSRYRLVEKRDFTGAADDIEAALRLAAGIEDNSTYGRLEAGAVCRVLALKEVAQWGREGLLSKQQASEMLRRLDHHRFDRRRAIRVAIEGEQRRCPVLLDSLYASGEHGPYILGRQANRRGDWVLGSLNLLSPLFKDRAGGARFWQRACDLATLGDPSLAELARRDEMLRRARSNPVVPSARMYWPGHEEAARSCMEAEAAYAGAVTSLGLAAYKADRGRYPSSLEELMPEYLVNLPADPFADGPLRYRLEGKGGFSLYSVGRNGRDDGGSPNWAERAPLDFVIVQPRQEPWREEWVVVDSAAVTRPAGAPDRPQRIRIGD